MRGRIKLYFVDFIHFHRGSSVFVALWQVRNWCGKRTLVLGAFVCHIQELHQKIVAVTISSNGCAMKTFLTSAVGFFPLILVADALAQTAPAAPQTKEGCELICAGDQLKRDSNCSPADMMAQIKCQEDSKAVHTGCMKTCAAIKPPPPPPPPIPPRAPEPRE